jgi:hypothetical protein
MWCCVEGEAKQMADVVEATLMYLRGISPESGSAQALEEVRQVLTFFGWKSGRGGMWTHPDRPGATAELIAHGKSVECRVVYGEGQEEHLVWS